MASNTSGRKQIADGFQKNGPRAERATGRTGHQRNSAGRTGRAKHYLMRFGPGRAMSETVRAERAGPNINF